MNLIGQRALRILCAIALVLVGFAHQPLIGKAGELIPSELALYQLPDGTPPVLCITSKGAGGKEHSKAPASGCEACRISAAILLPAPPMTVCEHLVFFGQDVPAPKAVAFHRQLYPPNTGPRAPPVLQIVA